MEQKEFNYFQLLENIVQVSNACAEKSDMRYALQHVVVESVGDMVRVKAANAHVYAERLQPSYKKEVPYMLIDSSDMPKIKLFLKALPKALDTLSFAWDHKSKKAIFSYATESLHLQCATYDYPDTERVKPSKDRKEIAVGVNPELIMQVAKALGMSTKKRGANHAKLFIDADNKLAPIRIEMNDGSGLVMPLRI